VVQKEGGAALSDRKIFQRDVLWLEEVAGKQGILVAEVSTPSLGVGYEVALARHRYRIPVICLFRAGGGRRCSAMIAGDPGIRLIRYDEKSLETALDELVEEVRNAANKTAGGAVLPA
jgi:hypothetical protein